MRCANILRQNKSKEGFQQPKIVILCGRARFRACDLQKMPPDEKKTLISAVFCTTFFSRQRKPDLDNFWLLEMFLRWFCALKIDNRYTGTHQTSAIRSHPPFHKVFNFYIRDLGCFHNEWRTMNSSKHIFETNMVNSLQYFPKMLFIITTKQRIFKIVKSRGQKLSQNRRNVFLEVIERSWDTQDCSPTSFLWFVGSFWSFYGVRRPR